MNYLDGQALLAWYGAEKDIPYNVIVLAKEGRLSCVRQYDSWICQATHTYFYGRN